MVLIENVLENGPLGTVNGVAQVLGSGVRSIAPTFAVTFVAGRCSLMLPKNIKAKRRST